MLRSWLKNSYFRLPIVRELRQIRAALQALQVRGDHTAETIRMLDLELERHPRYADPRRLQRSAFQVCSQNGEDGVIHEIFRRIGPTDRTFAEVGVGDGSENNTAFLLSQGWTGFWLDGSDNVLRTIAERPDLRNGCVKTRISFVTRENIAGLFAELGVPKEFDLLSLDIDQNTYYAWESLGDYRPRVVVVEYNASLPADVEWKVHYDAKRMWDGSHNFGASLKAFETLGRRLGYSLVGCEFIGSNAFFVRDDLLGDKFAAPFTAENHYEPPRFALLHRRGHAAQILDRKSA
jgi:hypothetical protein